MENLRDKFNKISDHITKHQNDGKKTFNFISTSEYDLRAHETGSYSTISETRVKEIFFELDKFIMENKKLLKNTLFIILSDHGLTECAPHNDEIVSLLSINKIEQNLRTIPKDSILISGSRFAHIYLKQDLNSNQIDDLLNEFIKQYPKSRFELKKNLRKKGYCLDHKRCGDIVAIAGPNCILSTTSEQTHTGFHGGPSAEEMLAMKMIFDIAKQLDS